MKKQYPFLVAGALCALWLGASPTIANADPPGWSYYRELTVTNSSGSTLNDFQVKIIVDTQTPIGAGKLQKATTYGLPTTPATPC